MEDLRQSLLRRSGKIRPLFERVVGGVVIGMPAGGPRVGLWDVALIGVHWYSQPHAVGQLADRVHMMIGQVESDPSLLRPPRSTEESEGGLQGPVSSSVFIVHGHSPIRHEVTLLVTKLRLEPIVIAEQPKRGRTVIEQIEHYGDVGFAVVLMTGDDRGGLASDPYESQALRARQNVVFELGFFVGRLGRARVAALHEAGVELPSDYHGVLYIGLDAGGAWKTDLASEMRAAGLPVDLNNLR